MKLHRHQWAVLYEDRPAWPQSQGRGKRTVYYECRVKGCGKKKKQRKSVRR